VTGGSVDEIERIDIQLGLPGTRAPLAVGRAA